jgi:hypothetical protein
MTLIGDEQERLDAVAKGLGYDLLRWAGLVNEDETEILEPISVIEGFGDAVQFSSIPEACAQIAESQ